MILPQKLFYPVVENCFHFAFRHDFLAVTRKPQQRIEAKAKMRKGIPKIKAFFHKKRTLQPKSSQRKEPGKSKVHSPLRPWMFRSVEKLKIKPQSKVKFKASFEVCSFWSENSEKSKVDLTSVYLKSIFCYFSSG